jgi:hypothetical protein
MKDVTTQLRKLARSKRIMIGGILVVAAAAAGSTVALTTSGATTSFYATCMEPSTQHEREDGQEWLKLKIAAEEKECSYYAKLHETISPGEEREAKAKFRAAHPPTAVTPQAEEESAGRRVTGIVEGPQTPPRNPGEPYFFSVSHWTGQVNGRWYIVWAGATTEAPNPDGKTGGISSGVVVGLEPAKISSGEAAKIVGIFPAPGGDREALNVAAASGSTLTLQSPGGETSSFDVATLRYD